MALALQCPDCGHKVPLSGVGTAGTYRCQECGRALKVPQQMGSTAPPAATPPGRAPAEPTAAAEPNAKPAAKPTGRSRRAVPGPGATEVLDLSAIAVGVSAGAGAGAALGTDPATPGPGAEGDGTGPAGQARATGPSRPSLPSLSWPVRAWWWLLWALPIGGLVGAGIARQFGWLTQKDLEGTLLRTEWDRFWPVARMLPLCALVAALVAEVGLRAWSVVTARVGQGVVTRLMAVHVALCAVGALVVGVTSISPLLVVVAGIVAWVVVAGVLIRSAAASLRPTEARAAPVPANPGRRSAGQRRAGS